MNTPRVQVFRRVADEAQTLPWEEGQISREYRQKVGIFLQPTRCLLHRNPTARSTVAQFRQEVKTLLAM